MDSLYKYWLCYYLFVKRVYKKRWDTQSASISALSNACIFVNLLLIAVILELIFDFEGVISLMNQGLPLAPLAFAASFIIFTPIVIVMSKVKDKRRFFRYALAKVGNKRVYTILYLIISGISFVLFLILIVTNGLS